MGIRAKRPGAKRPRANGNKGETTQGRTGFRAKRPGFKFGAWNFIHHDNEGTAIAFDAILNTFSLNLSNMFLHSV